MIARILGVAGVMPAAEFTDVFVALRSILEPYASRPGFVRTESRDHYEVASTTKTDRAGRPLAVASVEINKRYVSFHLMPIYMNPVLQQAVSPALRQRMQGKACFNFTAVDAALFDELDRLTVRAVADFAHAKLPWPTRKAEE